MERHLKILNSRLILKTFTNVHGTNQLYQEVSSLSLDIWFRMDGRTEGCLRGWINKRVNERAVGLMVPENFFFKFCFVVSLWY